MDPAIAPPLRPLVDAIYDALFSPTGWPKVLRHIAREAGVAATGIKLQWADRMEQTWWGLPDGFERAFVDEYWRMDPWTLGSRRHPPGSFLLSRDMVPDAELHATAFYNDLCRPYGFKDAVGAVLLRDDDLYVTFGMMRPAGAHGGGGAEAATGIMLLPHLQRACALQQRLQRLDERRLALEDAIDGIPLGVLLVDASCRLVWANRVADEIVRRGDGLAVRQNRLHAIDRVRARLVADAVAAGRTTCVRIDRLHGGRPYVLVVAPPHAIARRLGQRPARVLYVVDPERDRVPSRTVLAEVFGLTASETEVALSLVQRRSVHDTARRLGVSVATIRTHLRRIFSKTDTHRQASLVHLLTHMHLPGVPDHADQASRTGPPQGDP